MYKYVPQPEDWTDPGTGVKEASVQVLYGARYVEPSQLTKLAYQTKTHQKVLEFVSGMKKDPGKIYVQVNAMGAGEYYGPNINSDYFSEPDLAPMDPGAGYGYRTFLEAGVYRNHKNKDRDLSFGEVLLAIYNREMRRVELVIAVDRTRACKFGHSDLIERLDRVEAVPVSMGCRVVHDVCRIIGCGNRARTRFDYCSHMLQSKGRILSDGQQVCVDNPRPVFFDISFVVVNADKIGYTMMKFASADDPHSILSELDPATTMLDESEYDGLIKRIPAMSARLAPAFESCTDGLPADLLSRVFSRSPLHTGLAGLASRGVLLTPKEFGAATMFSSGRPHLASGFLDGSRRLPAVTRITIMRLPSSGVDGLGDLSAASHRSLQGPLRSQALTRIFGGQAPQRVESPQIEAASGFAQKIADAYPGYRSAILDKISAFISPDALPVGALSVEDGVKKFASAPAKNFLMALPLAYLYSAYLGRQNEQELNAVEHFARTHPILTAAAAAGMSQLLRAAGDGTLPRV